MILSLATGDATAAPAAAAAAAAAALPQPRAAPLRGCRSGAGRRDRRSRLRAGLRRPGRAQAGARAAASTSARSRAPATHGRIVREDVEAFAKGGGAPPQHRRRPRPRRARRRRRGGLDLLPWPKVDFAKFGPIERKELSRIKKISAANLHRNWVVIPHVTTHDEADITDLEQFRVQMNKELEKSGVKISMLPFMMKAAVATLKKFPEFNASLDGDALVLKNYWHIGFAADTPNGLMVPVIRDVDKKTVPEIAKEMGELAKLARDGKLKPDQMQGGTFTISSLGGIGGIYFTPIINAPEVAIMGVCKSYWKQHSSDGKTYDLAPDPAAVAVVGPPRDRRRRRGALQRPFRQRARRPAARAVLKGLAPMAQLVEVKVPDIGDFKDVAVIEVLVKPGEVDRGRHRPDHGRVRQGVDGDSVEPCRHGEGAEGQARRQGQRRLGDPGGRGGRRCRAAPAPAPAPRRSGRRRRRLPPRRAPHPRPRSYAGKADIECEMLVLGAGPGGYSAAFRSADLGMKTVLVERYATLGGVCLNVGCIPSKALLHTASVMDEVKLLGPTTASSTPRPKIDIDALRGFKDGVVKKLTGGLAGMAKARKVEVVTGVGSFLDPHHLEVVGGRRREEGREVRQGHHRRRLAGGEAALHARGRARRRLHRRAAAQGHPEAHAGGRRRHHRPGDGDRLLDAGHAHRRGRDARRPDAGRRPRPRQGVGEVQRAALRQRDAQDQDRRRARRRRPASRSASKARRRPKEPQLYDLVLVAVGRSPNGKKIGADKAGVAVTDRGFINVDKQMRTNVPHIFAIGDIVGQPMLAHKAVHEAHVAAEAAHGEPAFFDARQIPSVAYTDPEVAWAGKTEEQCKAEGIKVGKAVFPWAASGRAIANGRDEGFTKLLFDEATHRVDRRRHRRHACGRPDQRGLPGDRDGLRAGRHRQDHPPASDARRIDRHGGRGLRRPLHRPAAAEEEVGRAAWPLEPGFRSHRQRAAAGGPARAVRLGQQLARHRARRWPRTTGVYCVDLRNHGASPWAESMVYVEMADDVLQLIEREGAASGPAVMGHSMGGKTAMALALRAPAARRPAGRRRHRARWLCRPRSTPSPRPCAALDVVGRGQPRARCSGALAAAVPDAERRADFLMQNLRRAATTTSTGGSTCSAISACACRSCAAFPSELLRRALRRAGALCIAGARLRLRAAASDGAASGRCFHAREVEVIADAGHWVHADQPDALLRGAAALRCATAPQRSPPS